MLFLVLFVTAILQVNADRTKFSGKCDTAQGFGPPGGVYMCFDPYFKGTCWDWMPRKDKCYSFHKDTYQKPKSIGPNPGGHCVFYRETGCKGEILMTAGGKKLRCPGIVDAHDAAWYGSMKCFPTLS